MKKNGIISVKKEKSTDLKFKNWDYIAGSVANAFRMSEEEYNLFKNKSLAKLIASIPYLAGCEDPERTAVVHLGTYLLSTRIKPVANCKPSDDEGIFKRLELMSNFIGGDKAIIEKGMSLIALNMIADYARDIEVDRMTGKYNPVDSGAIDYEAERKRLESVITSVECKEMDDIMSLDEAIETYWEAG